MTTDLTPTLYDTVTGLRFNGYEWPEREGRQLSLPASRTLDSLVGSVLRFANLYPTLEDGASLSYMIGPRSLAIDVERRSTVNGSERIENVKLSFLGEARVPKESRLTGLAKGFEINQQAGIAIGTSVRNPARPALDFEQLAYFAMGKKPISNHTLADVLVLGNPSKLANLISLQTLYISNRRGFEANRKYLADNNIVTFSPVNSAGSVNSRQVFLESGLVANPFSQSSWWE